MLFRLIVILATSGVLLSGQIFSRTAKRITYGSAVPASCNPSTGDVFYKTGAPDLGIHYCSATDTWTPVGAGDTHPSRSSKANFVLKVNAGESGDEWAQIVAGGSGALQVTPSVGEIEIEIVSAVLGTKAAANAWTGQTSFQNTVNFCADAEASDTYACTISPAIASYTTGACYLFTANTGNTGAATVNFNALGAKTIKKRHDQDLATGDVESGQIVVVCYDGTNMQMTSQLAQ